MSILNQVLEFQSILNQINLDEFQSKCDQAVNIFCDALGKSLPVLICGNGGSAADAQHIAGELVGKFLMERKAFNVRALTVDTSVITSWANDVDYETIFSRQVEAYGQKNGVLLAISTSGNSKNIINAAIAAKTMGMLVVSMTGMRGGHLSSISDVLIDVPSNSTPRIQEFHVMIYHYICEQIELVIGGR
jgi:D-sedoheptulose 7-phosphate isomerase